MRLNRKLFRPLLQQADAARDQRRWNSAIEAYRRYLFFAPRHAPIWVQLGNCLKEAGELERARAAYGRARTLMPDNADIYLQMGHLAKLDDRQNDAIEAFQRAVDIDPHYGDAATELKRLGGRHPMKSVLVSPDRDRALNIADARRDRDRVARSADAIAAFLAKLPPPQRADGLIPQMLHFVFGFKQKGDIPYYGYMAIKSALHFNPGWRAYYYTIHEPSGENWDRIKDKVTVITLDDFDYYGNARLHHYAHKADIIRMLVLKKCGGAYLDIDTITRRSYEDLRHHDFVMGVQAAGSDSSSGLCNAVMFGKPEARFICRWLEEYDYFRSKGRDDLWDYHSVKLPVSLSAAHPEEITILDYRAFFFPLWTTIDRALFSETSGMFREDFEPAYCFHLWNGAVGGWLEEIDDIYIRQSRSLYAEIAREVEGIEHVPLDAKIPQTRVGEKA
ncbi:hypothetical protein TomTYG75_07620 [Sphingobium sp. TomTYG75]